MKKKLIPFILGLSMVAALPLAAHATDESPEPESGNVDYGTAGFAETRTADVDETELITAIPEYTLTIPRDTSIKRGARTAKIGHAKVTGNYFVKPYGVEVSISNKANFTNNTSTIQFSVEDTFASSGNHTYVTDSGTTAANKCRYYKTMVENETTHEMEPSTATYDRGDIAEINQSRDVVLKIADSQWSGKSGGLYKGSITFNAQLCADVTDGTGSYVDWVAVSQQP